MPSLILSPSDIFYLTGVRVHDIGEVMIVLNSVGNNVAETPSGIILCDQRTVGLFTDPSFQKIAHRSEWHTIWTKYPALETDPDIITETLKSDIEKHGIQLTYAPSMVKNTRIIKTEKEIQKLTKSQSLNLAIWEQFKTWIQPGMTEQEIARHILIQQLKMGGDGPSFPPIVAFGAHTAIPHHSPTNQKLTPGDPLLIDMGLIYEGYCSDMTRTCIYGDREGAHDMYEIANFVKRVAQQTSEYARPGMSVVDLDVYARGLMGDFAPFFTHSLGHGVGIDIHERPFLGKKSTDILTKNMVITIEPGLYFPDGIKEGMKIPGNETPLGTVNPFGVRHEEMFIVGENELILCV